MKQSLHRLLLTAWVTAVMLPHGVLAQSQPGANEGGSDSATAKRAWEIKPTIGLELTQTDNATLRSDNKQSDLIVRTSPGIRIHGESARVRAYIDFKLQQIDYTQTPGRDRTQRALNAAGTLEVLDNWLFLDLSGRISRQALSVFGTPASGSDSINANVIETTTYQAAPYIQGRLFGGTEYRVRFDNTWFSAKNGPMRDTTIQALQANLSGGTGLSKLTWGLAANAQETSYANNRKNETDSLRANLVYMLDPQLRFTAIGGRESNDYIDFQQQSSSITGWGVEWAASERTKLGWTQENRYFGTGHNFSFTHRTPRTAWRLSDSRDVMIRTPQTMSFSMGTYFEMFNEQLRSSMPDEQQRTAYVLALLQSLGIPQDANVISGIQSSRASINRTKEASFVWTGVRNVITLSAQSSDRTALGTVDLPDDFSNFSQTIRQKGVNLSLSHKLTPLTTLTLMGNKSQTSGNTNNLTTDRTLYSLMLTSKLGANTTGSLGMRRTEVSGFVDYVENAVLGSMLMLF